MQAAQAWVGSEEKDKNHCYRKGVRQGDKANQRFEDWIN